jgi:hypothetical protein
LDPQGTHLTLHVGFLLIAHFKRHFFLHFQHGNQIIVDLRTRINQKVPLN